MRLLTKTPNYPTLMRALTLQSLLPNLLAGLTAGLVTLVYSISFAALIFSGNLTHFFPQGVGSALIGTTITAIIVASRSSFPFVVAGPDSNSSAILAVMASAIAQSLESPDAAQRLFPTVWVAITLGTILTGLFLFILGWLRLGRWARFIPYPVMGGFLAGTGWLLARSSFKVMAGVPLGLAQLPQLMQFESFIHWLIGLLFALVLLFVLDRYKHFLVLPCLLVAGVVLFHALWGLTDTLFSKINPEGWFFKPFPKDELWQAWSFSTFAQVDWPVLLHQSGTLVAMMVVVVISILLNATGLELATSSNGDLDRELRVNGIANLLNGFCGGMVGYLSINRSLLSRQAGANSPLAGVIAGGLCGAVLIFGSSFLSYFPKPILGGLLLYIGLSLLIRWVYQAWFKFPRVDYALIVLILVIIAIWGFLQGVGAGIVISCFLFIFNYSRNPVIKYAFSGATHQSNVNRSFPQQRFLHQKGDRIYILALQGFIFFGTANALLDQIRQRLENPNLPNLEFVVFDFRLVSGLDSSAVLSFIKMKQLAQKEEFNLVLTHLQPIIQKQLQRGGLIELEDKICYLFSDLDRGIEWCENQILETSKLRRRRFVPLALQLKSIFPAPEFVSQLMKYLELLKIPEGEFLFRQGDSCDGLYFVESGQVSVVLELPSGQTKRLQTYNSGTIIGEMGLYGNAPRSASVVADQFSHLYYLSTQAFERIETEEPRLAASFHKFIVNLLAERLKHSKEELQNLLQ
ncbi:SLC26A/SulP transporter family protein [Allocoleopsis sp.]|uniref:SLC26A/SulP transporter family protein n=1 Tax=Allocoleopsis sp. TaxID=3088169 RepID=UPI002FD44D79